MPDPAFAHPQVAPAYGMSGPPAQTAPGGLKVSLRSMVPWAAVAAVAGALWWAFVSPTEDGRMASTAVRALERVTRAAGNAPAYTKVDFEIIRNTKGSIFSHDVAQVFAPKSKPGPPPDADGGADLNRRLMASHAPGTVMAMSSGFTGPGSSCSVRLSAQALNYPGTPYLGMVNRMGAPEDAFLLLLGHESAHCFWNPALHFEQRMDREPETAGGMHPRFLASHMPLAWNLSESYADAYILMLGYRMDLSFYQRALVALTEFRTQTTRPGAPHATTHTLHAVQALAPSLPTMQSALGNNWDIMNRYVMSAALTGSMRWLVNQGMPQHDAIGRIQTVLQGQGIEFSLRNVGGQDFLVVHKAPVTTNLPDMADQ